MNSVSEKKTRMLKFSDVTDVKDVKDVKDAAGESKDEKEEEIVQNISIDHYGIDLNAIIHPITQKIFGIKREETFTYGKKTNLLRGTGKKTPNERKTVPHDKEPFSVSMLKIYSLVCEEIERQTKVVDPKKTLILVLDGCAGSAKSFQQRQRRFKSAKEKSKEEFDLFDSNCISTGTDFMLGLCDYIKNFIKEKKKTTWKNLKVIFSSDRVPGEGEHKIIRMMLQFLTSPASCIGRGGKKTPLTKGIELEQMDDIREITKKDDAFCIFSPDADLIILALGSHIDNMFILRNNDRSDVDCKHFLVNIRQLKNIIIDIITKDKFDTGESIFDKRVTKSEKMETIKRMEKDIKSGAPKIVIRTMTKKEEEGCINDFVLMCCFFGNDFFQRVPTMEINDANMKKILAVYQLVKNREERLVNSKKTKSKLGKPASLRSKERYIWSILQRTKKGVLVFNMRNLFSFLGELADNEVEMLDNRSPSFEDLCLYDEKTESNRSLEGYMEKYLKVNLNIDASDEKKVDDFCEEYLRALTFVVRYYLDGMPDWHYFFPYHYTPFISQLYAYLAKKVIEMSNAKETPPLKEAAESKETPPSKETSANKVFLKRTTILNFPLSENFPLTPHAQLLSILPPRSKSLLPERFQHLFESDSPLKEFYPLDFKEDVSGKKHEYEAIILLPFIDMNLLLKHYKKTNRGFEELTDVNNLF